MRNTDRQTNRGREMGSTPGETNTAEIFIDEFAAARLNEEETLRARGSKYPWNGPLPGVAPLYSDEL